LILKREKGVIMNGTLLEFRGMKEDDDLSNFLVNHL
jgi:hypothetical protein